MSEAPKEWLDRLEATVRQTTESLQGLRSERDELARRAEKLEGQVASLEKELAAARKSAGEGKAKGRGAGKGKAADAKDAADAKAAEEARAAWQEERREIRRRVQALTKRLEGLLDT